MKTEVRFKDEWRIFNILKSGVKGALGNILNTTPEFDSTFQNKDYRNNNGDIFSQFQTKKDFQTPTNPDQKAFTLKVSDSVYPVYTNLERANLCI